MQVRVSYAHSAFPKYSPADAVAGLSGMTSRMETTATAILKRYDTSSPWSFQPAPVPNSLSTLIERHWGADKASEAMYQILTQRYTPRKPTRDSPDLSPKVKGAPRQLPTPPDHTHPVVPTRRASLQNLATIKPSPRQKETTGVLQHRILSHGNISQDEAGVYRTTYGTDSSRGSPSSNVWRADGSRSGRSGPSFSNRGSPGAERTKNLIPKLPDFSLEGRSSRRTSRRSATISSRGERASWKWSWASWF